MMSNSLRFLCFIFSILLLVSNSIYAASTIEEKSGTEATQTITREELSAAGNLSLPSWARNLSVASASLSESNQFTSDGQGNEGIGNINLRGLGADRTLVLLNGRRLVSTEHSGVDINSLPTSALAKIDILRDGASSLYGSDAIAGVVNFYTRSGFRGFELGGDFAHIESSDGNWNANGIFGVGGDRWNWSVAAEYGERGELAVRDRDWTLVAANQNRPGGRSSVSNPAQIRWDQALSGTANVTIRETGRANRTVNIPVTGIVENSFVDPQCQNLGATSVPSNVCNFRYADFDNLVEQTETAKLYSEFKLDFSDNHQFRLEALYSKVDLPEWRTSPSYPPRALISPDRVIPNNHPGLVDFRSFYNAATEISRAGATTAKIQDSINASAERFLGRALATGGTVVFNGVGALRGNAAARALQTGTPTVYALGRVFGVTGVVGTGQGATSQRETETYRLATAFSGSFANEGLKYDIGLTWSKQDRFVAGQDANVERTALALNGYGGPNCMLPSAAAITAGTARPGTNGCEYFNPFSRAIQTSAVNGATNPDYNANVTNSADLLNWLIEERNLQQQNELFVADITLEGHTGLSLPGGEIDFIAGLQGRRARYTSDYSSIADRAQNPCPWTLAQSVALGFTTADQLSPNCATRTGVSALFTASDDDQTSTDVYSAFAQVTLPVTDDLSLEVALRYEEYSSDLGSSIDPKFAAYWRFNDAFSFRGSLASTFRAPPASILQGTNSRVNYVASTNAVKTIDIVGNQNLEPEAALNTNIGVIFTRDKFSGSLDLWWSQFNSSFQTEDFNAIVSSYYGTYNCDDNGSGAIRSNEACNLLRQHIFPIAAHTDDGAIERLEVNWINGHDIVNSGIDFQGQYAFDIDPDLFQGHITLGVQGRYYLQFDIDSSGDINGVRIADKGELAGQLNYDRGLLFTSKPKLKLNASIKYNLKEHQAQAVAHYVSQFSDDDAPSNLGSLSTVGDHLTVDLIYQYSGIDNLVLSASVINVNDQRPPEVRSDLNYDPFTHDPVGRSIKLGFSYEVGK